MAQRETAGPMRGHFADGNGHSADLAECECITRAVRAAYSDGMNLGAAVEHKAAVAAIAEAALHVLGQDRGDGVTDLGRLGEWVAGSGEHRAFKV
jgi:hypothetical protein